MVLPNFQGTGSYSVPFVFVNPWLFLSCVLYRHLQDETLLLIFICFHDPVDVILGKSAVIACADRNPLNLSK
jgi:hypothetical protein